MRIVLILFSFVTSLSVFSQTKILEIYVYENHNRGFVQNAQIQLIDSISSTLLFSAITNESGLASFHIQSDVSYIINIAKTDLKPEVMHYKSNASDKQYIKIAMDREAGYILDVTLAEERTNLQMIAEGLIGCQIEIYNRTLKKEELVLKNYPNPNFQFSLKPGNHYTMLIRKEDYVAKRIEIYVNIEGCILCLDGISDVSPGVADNISSTGFGTVLANIELKKAAIGSTFQIKNINYDFDKYNIRPDAAKILNNAVAIFIDNPGLELELGSHTDARGDDAYNLTLSHKRAESAMNYLISNGVEASRISFKGYGETQIINECKNNVQCTDQEHEANRRTELKITGIKKSESDSWFSLERIITEEEFKNEMFKGETKIGGNAEYNKPSPGKINAQKSIEKENSNQIDQNTNYNYFVSLGAFKTQATAQKREGQAKKLGITDTKIIFIQSKNLYYVGCAFVNSLEEAEAKKEKILSKNMDAIVKKRE